MVRTDENGEPYNTNFDMVWARTKENKSTVTVVIALLIVIGVIASTMFGGSSQAPDFNAQWVESDGGGGDEFGIAELSGKTIVLDLMSESCAPCKDIADDALKPLHEKYSEDENVLIISIAVGGETPESIHEYAEKWGYDWLHAVDVESSVFNAYSAIQIPQILVINSGGEIVFHKKSNRITLEELETAVETADSSIGISSGSGSIFAMAIGAGALSFFSPCSFPLLPGYVSYYLMKETELDAPKNERMKRALPAGIAASIGILSVFVALAILIVPFSQAVKSFVPTLIPITGAFILVMGIVMITDYDYSWISRPIKQKFSNLVGRFRKNSDPSPDSEDDGLMGQYFYGLGYGAASAGCTAPVFIALLMASMKYTIFGALVIFGLYAASTAVLMITFTLLVAASQETIVDKMKASTGVIKKVGGSVLILVGVYLVYEYFTTWI